MNKNTKIATKIVGSDEKYVEIETVELRAEWPEPFCTSVKIEHHGDPEATASQFHRLISERAGKR